MKSDKSEEEDTLPKKLSSWAAAISQLPGYPDKLRPPPAPREATTSEHFLEDPASPTQH